jgi:hypothetical protein
MRCGMKKIAIVLEILLISSLCYGADVTNSDGVILFTITPSVDKTNLQGFEIRIYDGDYMLWNLKTPEIHIYFDYADKHDLDPVKWRLPMTLTVKVWSLGSVWVDGYGFKETKSTSCVEKTVEIQENMLTLKPIEIIVQ